jgi:hypothetical protein
VPARKVLTRVGEDENLETAAEAAQADRVWKDDLRRRKRVQHGPLLRLRDLHLDHDRTGAAESGTLSSLL